MNIFTHQGKHFISINGKDYFLIRCYKKSYHNYISIQVHGKTPLRKEDLPSKDWEILATKSGKQKVWTAFKKGYFNYFTERENPTLAFIGASTQGSYYIALRHIVRRFRIKADVKKLFRLSEQYATGELESSRLERINDAGNSGAGMVVVSFDRSFDEKEAKLILEEEEA